VTRGTVLVWTDEMWVGRQGLRRRIWAPRGESVRQRLDVGRVGASLALAVDVIAGTLDWEWLGGQTEAHLSELLRHWAEAGIGAMVWDRAGVHRGAKVRAVAREVGIRLVCQPPCSPELNPVERLIEALRARTEGRVHGSLPAKQEAVEAELRALAADPAAVKRLVDWDWIHQAILELPGE
jgi:hypothetical protein